MRDLPLCSGCLNQQPFLHDTRHESLRLQQSIQRRERQISAIQRCIHTYMNIAEYQEYQSYVMKLIDAVASQNELIANEVWRRNQLHRCFHDSLLDHRMS